MWIGQLLFWFLLLAAEALNVQDQILESSATSWFVSRFWLIISDVLYDFGWIVWLRVSRPTRSPYSRHRRKRIGLHIEPYDPQYSESLRPIPASRAFPTRRLCVCCAGSVLGELLQVRKTNLTQKPIALNYQRPRMATNCRLKFLKSPSANPLRPRVCSGPLCSRQWNRIVCYHATGSVIPSIDSERGHR